MPSNFTIPTEQDAIKYEAELTEVCAILQSWHPIGEVRGIGLLEAAEALRQLKEMHVKSTLAGEQNSHEFAMVLREWWSFSDQQQHTHSWHTREDFIDRELPKLLAKNRQEALRKMSVEVAELHAKLDAVIAMCGIPKEKITAALLTALGVDTTTSNREGE